MTVNVRESIQKIMGWCPNASIFNKKVEEDIQGY